MDTPRSPVNPESENTEIAFLNELGSVLEKAKTDHILSAEEVALVNNTIEALGSETDDEQLTGDHIQKAVDCIKRASPESADELINRMRRLYGFAPSESLVEEPRLEVHELEDKEDKQGVAPQE